MVSKVTALEPAVRESAGEALCFSSWIDSRFSSEPDCSAVHLTNDFHGPRAGRDGAGQLRAFDR